MKIAFISTYPPISSGISEFCFDLINGIKYAHSDTHIDVFAINFTEKAPHYTDKCVRGQFDPQQKQEYSKIAQEINKGNYDVCVLQHEFNLFGGENNSYIFELTGTLTTPLVSIIHTVPISRNHQNSDLKKEHLLRLASNSTCLVTMTKYGAEGLVALGIDRNKVQTILHGAPEMPERSHKGRLQDELGLTHALTIMEFGLFRASKGAEYLVQAMPDVVKQIPDTQCLIIGPTDNNTVEPYVEMLKKLATDLHVQKSIKFISKFLSREELFKYIVASDIVVTPYQRVDKISSGVLTFAMYAGQPIVATRYLAAKELLKNIGLFIPFKDHTLLSKYLVKLGTNKSFYGRLQKKTARRGSGFSWNVKGVEYYDLFKKIGRIH